MAAMGIFQGNILLVSNQEPLAQAIRELLAPFVNLALHVCKTIAEAHRLLQKDRYYLGLIHLDSVAEEMEVHHFLRSAKEAGHSIKTLILADCYHAEQVAALLHSGATDYLTQEARQARLDYLVRAHSLSLGARLGPPCLASEAGETDSPLQVLEPILGERASQIMCAAFEESSLLFTGEHGTGKMHLARMIHQLSPRRHQPFLVVNCEHPLTPLLESELFGHAAGALPGGCPEHDGKLVIVGAGFLVLDEIGALPLYLQDKLIQVLERSTFLPMGSDRNRPFQGRLIALSASRSLQNEVLAGRFRQRLYDRLQSAGFHLPPLRTQREAIDVLCRRFLAEACSTRTAGPLDIHDSALRVLRAYDWPGNIRELRNVIERLAAQVAGPEIRLRDLPEAIAESRLRTLAETGGATETENPSASSRLE
jgi:DNA-binding NtrC family response regulator